MLAWEWQRHDVARVRAPEHAPFSRQPVQVRRLDVAVARETQGVVAKGIDRQQDDVARRRGGRRGRRRVGRTRIRPRARQAGRGEDEEQAGARRPPHAWNHASRLGYR